MNPRWTDTTKMTTSACVGEGEEQDLCWIDTTGRSIPIDPADPLGSEYGWITEDGRFHPCTSWGHIPLARELGVSYRAAERRFVLVSRSTNGGAFGNISVIRNITQRQLNTMFDWAQRHGYKIPHGILQ